MVRATLMLRGVDVKNNDVFSERSRVRLLPGEMVPSAEFLRSTIRRAELKLAIFPISCSQALMSVRQGFIPYSGAWNPFQRVLRFVVL